jgi:hypothetical protein
MKFDDFFSFDLLANAKDFFDFVDNKLRIPQSGIYKRPVYRYDEEIPGDKILDYKPGNQNRKIHNISSITEKLQVRPLSYIPSHQIPPCSLRVAHL